MATVNSCSVTNLQSKTSRTMYLFFLLKLKLKMKKKKKKKGAQAGSAVWVCDLGRESTNGRLFLLMEENN